MILVSFPFLFSFFLRDIFGGWGGGSCKHVVLFTQILRLFVSQLRHQSRSLHFLSRGFSWTPGLEASGQRWGSTSHRSPVHHDTWTNEEHVERSQRGEHGEHADRAPGSLGVKPTYATLQRQDSVCSATGHGHRDTTHSSATSRKS